MAQSNNQSYYSNRGGYNNSSRGGYNSSSRGGYNNSSRDGYNNSSRGGYNSTSRDGYNNSSRGGYNSSSRDGYNNSSRGGHSTRGRYGNPSYDDVRPRDETKRSQRGGYSNDSSKSHDGRQKKSSWIPPYLRKEENMQSNNAYALLEDEKNDKITDKKIEKQLDGPKIVKPKTLEGVWSKSLKMNEKSIIEVEDKPKEIEPTDGLHFIKSESVKENVKKVKLPKQKKSNTELTLYRIDDSESDDEYLTEDYTSESENLEETEEENYDDSLYGYEPSGKRWY